MARNLLRKTFPSDYRSPFRKFLKPVFTLRKRESARMFALIRISLFKPYKGLPQEFITPLDLGRMGKRKAGALTEQAIAEEFELTPLGQKSEVLRVEGVYALRRIGARRRIGPVWKKKDAKKGGRRPLRKRTVRRLRREKRRTRKTRR